MRKLIYLLTLSLFVTGITFASFPVKSTENQKQEVTETSKIVTSSELVNENLQISQENLENLEKNATDSMKSSGFDNDTIILLVLWLLLAGLAGHRWYAGKPVGSNILFILTAGGCGIWAIIDLIKILQGKFM